VIERGNGAGLCYPLAVSRAIYQPFPMGGAARGQIWHHVPATRRPRHFHAEPELNLVTAGRGTFGVGDLVLPVAKGDLLCWTPGQDHELIEASEDFDLFVVGVSAAFSERVLGSDNLSPHQGVTLSRLSSEQVAAVLPTCRAHSIHADVTVTERRVGDLWRMVQGFRQTSAKVHTLTRRSLSSLISSPELSRDEVALRACGSPGEISRQFRRDMGVALTPFRTRLRLLRFIALVDGGEHTLLSAAIEAGFGSYSQCHRVFHGTMGCSPREYFATSIRRAIDDAVAPLGG
jgi:AraC-like DNA-binding protein